MKNKEKVIGSIVILLLISIFLCVGYFISRPKKRNSKDIFVESSNIEKDNSVQKDNKKESRLICVQISGAVNKPGVYYLQAESRIKDLVNEAGGFTQDADMEKIKLVQKLLDSDWVYIYKKGESNVINPVVPAYNSQSSGGLVDLNTATMEQLNELPGIGDTLAKRIYNYRLEHGPFSSIEDLKKVGGIGDGIINKFKDLVEIR